MKRNKNIKLRMSILEKLKNNLINTKMAALELNLSERQTKRLLKRYIKYGESGIVHGNTGRSPVNKLSSFAKEKVKELYTNKYKDFNISHFKDMLLDEEKISISYSTLYRMLTIPKVNKQTSNTHRLRPRCEYYGQLVQIDGSTHKWFGNSYACLLSAIDDATGQILHAHFEKTETQLGYLKLMENIGKEKGLPMAYYHDRHTIFRSPKEESIKEQLNGIKPMSKLGFMLYKQGVESISAHSPQAKGRIERCFKTFQNRLPNELKLKGINTIEEANQYLKDTYINKHNQRFAIEYKNKESVFIKLDSDTDLSYMFSICETRKVSKNNSISFNNKIYQLLDKDLFVREVEIHINSKQEVNIYNNKIKLEYIIIEKQIKTPAIVKENSNKEHENSKPNHKQCKWAYQGICN